MPFLFKVLIKWRKRAEIQNCKGFLPHEKKNSPHEIPYLGQNPSTQCDRLNQEVYSQVSDLCRRFPAKKK